MRAWRAECGEPTGERGQVCGIGTLQLFGPRPGDGDLLEPAVTHVGEDLRQLVRDPENELFTSVPVGDRPRRCVAEDFLERPASQQPLERPQVHDRLYPTAVQRVRRDRVPVDQGGGIVRQGDEVLGEQTHGLIMPPRPASDADPHRTSVAEPSPRAVRRHVLASPP